MSRTPLPIDAVLPNIVAALKTSPFLVLEAPPGAGKTTRVPSALLEAGLAGQGEVVVLQPRRLATRLAAARVAEEHGEAVGETVGYQVRFEDVGGPKTRLRFVTEGVLTRRLLSRPTLPEVGLVVIDEFHERHLAGDLALAMLHALARSRRPDLKLVVMSATLDAGPIAAYLGGCPVVRSEGRRFDVAIEYLPTPDERPLDQQVLAGLKRLLASGATGDVLVFLPGAAEIRRAQAACEELTARHGIDVHALHGDLSNAEQDRAVRPGPRRKLILSTNVAETSVTIEGIGAVIDSGLARVAGHSPWTGLPTLKVARVSKASAAQRAGRAGRTREGVCLRLYTRHDFETRPEHDLPEIRRLDLAETVLSLKTSGVPSVSAFPFFEAPTPASLEAAQSLLALLGALQPDGALSDVGRRLVDFPVHPRLGRLLLEAERRGVSEEGAVLAALLGERDIRREARAGFGGRGRQANTSGPSDLLEMLERFERATGEKLRADALDRLGLDGGAVRAVDRVRRQLGRLLRRGPGPRDLAAREEALLLSVLAAFPDRVAKRKKPRAAELVLFGGGSATLSETSVVHDAELLVAVDAEERPGTRGGVLVRVASKVEPEWLLGLDSGALQEIDELRFEPSSQRVERVTQLSYGNLVLEETRAPAPPSDEVSRVLVEAAWGLGPSAFVDAEALEHWSTRIDLLREAFPEAQLPVVDESLLRRALESAAAGRRSLPELKEANLLEHLQAGLTPEQARLLSSQLPDRVTLPGGRAVKVHYEKGKPPWIESRLQDFFGMAQGPKICGGRVPIVIHLLAPNQRAVQVTTDLAGFWERHYPALKKELSRRYPRHAWPDDPRYAHPPAPKPRNR